MAAQRCPHPSPGTFECVTLHGTGDVTAVIKLRILRWRDYPGLFGQAPNVTGAPLVTQMVNNLPPMWETWVQSLGQEDPVEKGMSTHSSILAWGIPWTEEPGKLQPTELPRVRHN